MLMLQNIVLERSISYMKILCDVKTMHVFLPISCRTNHLLALQGLCEDITFIKSPERVKSVRFTIFIHFLIFILLSTVVFVRNFDIFNIIFIFLFIFNIFFHFLFIFVTFLNFLFIFNY